MKVEGKHTEPRLVKNGSKYRNFPMVPRVIFGAGSFDQLGEILMPHRRHAEAPVIFLVDDVFEGKPLANRIPAIFETSDVDAADLHLVLSPGVERSMRFSGGKLARIDDSRCTGCGACEDYCPVRAIAVDGEGIAKIDPEMCCGCGLCALHCPDEAIQMKPLERDVFLPILEGAERRIAP